VPRKILETLVDHQMGCLVFKAGKRARMKNPPQNDQGRPPPFKIEGKIFIINWVAISAVFP
jgi:hypothetical protein